MQGENFEFEDSSCSCRSHSARVGGKNHWVKWTVSWIGTRELDQQAHRSLQEAEWVVGAFENVIMTMKRVTH